MATLATAAAIATVVGTVVTAAGTITAGRQARADANFQATQLEGAAKEESAAAQREAMEQRRKTNFLLSRQQAVAGASGFGALDPTVLDLAGDITQEGGYREGLIKYGGEQRARGLRGQASAARVSGDAAFRGSLFSAAGTVAYGFSSMFSKYGGSGPPGSDPFALEMDEVGGTGDGGFVYG